MKVIKGFLVALVIVLCVGALASDIFAIWIHLNGDKHKPIVTTNMSQLDTDVKNYIFELKYFENQDKLGKEMFEIKLTAYTGINKNKVYSYGIQILNPSNMNISKEYVSFKVNLPQWYDDEYYEYSVDYSGTQVTYFNSDETVSYTATTALNANNYPYVIDIDSTLYAIDFNKQVLEDTTYNAVGYAYNKYVTSDFNYFVYKMYSAMSTLTTGEGVYSNLNINLNDVFNIYEYNVLTGKFDKLSTFGYSAEFMGVKITYVERGAKIHTDSMFNQIGKTQKGGVIYG